MSAHNTPSGDGTRSGVETSPGLQQSDKRLLAQLAEGILTSHVRLDQMEERLKEATSQAVVEQIHDPVTSIQAASQEVTEQTEVFRRHLQQLETAFGEQQRQQEEFAQQAGARLEDAAASGSRTAHALFNELKERLMEATSQAVAQQMHDPVVAIQESSQHVTAQTEALGQHLDRLDTMAGQMETRLEKAEAHGIATAHTLLEEMETRLTQATSQAVVEQIHDPVTSIQAASQEVTEQTEVFRRHLQQLETAFGEQQRQQEEFARQAGARLETAMSSGLQAAHTLLGEMESRLTQATSQAVIQEIHLPANAVQAAGEEVLKQTEELHQDLMAFQEMARQLETNLLSATTTGVASGMKEGLDRLDELQALLAQRAEHLHATRDALDAMVTRLSRELPYALHAELLKQMGPILKGLETGVRTTVWTSREMLDSLDLLSNAQTARFVALTDQADVQQRKLLDALNKLEAAQRAGVEALTELANQHHQLLSDEFEALNNRLAQMVKNLETAIRNSEAALNKALTEHSQKIEALNTSVKNLNTEMQNRFEGLTKETNTSVEKAQQSIAGQLNRHRAGVSKQNKGLMLIASGSATLLTLDTLLPNDMHRWIQSVEMLDPSAKMGVAAGVALLFIILFFYFTAGSEKPGEGK